MFRAAKIFVAVALIMLSSGVAATSNLDTGSVSSYGPSSAAYVDGSKYYITLRDSELKESLRFLAKIAKLNIIIPEEVTGVVNIDFGNITPMDAMNSIIRTNGLDYAIEKDVLRIAKTGQFATTGEDLKTETIRLKFATAKDISENVKKLLTDRGSVLSDNRTNSLIVKERPSNLENVKNFVKDIDIRDSQILIKAKIVEATRDFSRSLGIQWGINNSGNRFNVVGITGVGQDDANRNLNVNMGADSPTSGMGLLIGKLKGDTNIDIQLTAAEQKGDARVISEPTIVTSNGIGAKIRSGETMLVKTTGDLNIGSGGVSGDTGLHEIETGVELDVTPQISGDGLVKLKIMAETSQPDFSRQVEGIPTIIGNTASTEVLILDGQTTIIGGLFKFTGSNTIKAVPFFSDIPVLGNLFKSRAKTKRNTELMIFIQPTVVRNYDDILETGTQMDAVEKAKASITVPPLDKEKKNRPSVPPLQMNDPIAAPVSVPAPALDVQKPSSHNPHLGNRYNR